MLTNCSDEELLQFSRLTINILPDTLSTIVSGCKIFPIIEIFYEKLKEPVKRHQPTLASSSSTVVFQVRHRHRDYTSWVNTQSSNVIYMQFKQINVLLVILGNCKYRNISIGSKSYLKFTISL